MFQDGNVLCFSKDGNVLCFSKDSNVLCFSNAGNVLCFRAASMHEMKQLTAEATPCAYVESSVSEFTSDVSSEAAAS